MTQHELTVYKCGFCKRHYLVKHACEWHEKHCGKNPNNWHKCFDGCPHLSRETFTPENAGAYSYITYTCTMLDKQMHSYVAERRRNPCVAETERMPLECAFHPDSMAVVNQVTERMLGEKYTTVPYDI